MIITCLENYHNFLKLVVDVPFLVYNIKLTFYSLYDEYFKFYDSSLNINVQQDILQAKPPPSTRIGKGYQLLFQKKKHEVPHQHKA